MPSDFRGSEVYVRLDAADPGLSDADRKVLRRPRRLPDGSIRYDAILARTGVKTYGNSREFTPASVLKQSVESLSGLAGFVEPHRIVTPQTAGQIAITARLASVKFDAQLGALIGEIVTDKPLDRSGNSIGWVDVALDATPGEHDGMRYDAVWSRATPNHFVSTHTPRSPGSHTRLDTGGRKMPQITIDGVSHEVEPAVAVAFVAYQKDNLQRLDVATEAVEVAEKAVTALTKERDDLKANRLDAEAVKVAVAARRKLEREAEPFLGDDDKKRLDAMDEGAVKLAVVTAPGVDAKGWTPEEIAGAYRLTVAKGPATRSDVSDNLANQRKSIALPTGGTRNDTKPKFSLRNCGATITGRA